MRRDNGMATHETQNTKFLRAIKGPPSEYGGSDLDDGLIQVASQTQHSTEAASTVAIDDLATDYGSDFDSEGEEEIVKLLTDLESNPLGHDLDLEDERESTKCLAHVPLVSSQSSETRSASFHTAREGGNSEMLLDGDGNTVVIDYHPTPGHTTLPRFAISTEQRNGRGTSRSSLPEASNSSGGERAAGGDELTPVAMNEKDLRSPIERFRTLPKKPLSVTDIVSPAWCELQYWFSLTKHGRVKRTPAMQQGSKVHKELEEEVHTYVKIDVTTKEDMYGLRIWNIIQGLRTLRATGLTRELEIWGVLDSEVVNGVIDELSYTCPDPELEATLDLSEELHTQPANQRSITDFYAAQSHPHSAWLGTAHPVRKIYVTDIKTRSTKHLPSGAASKGVQMQLMLYHRLLSDLAANTVDAETIFNRYQLDRHANFSPSFISSIADLDSNFIHDSPFPENQGTRTASATLNSELSQCNTLSLLWSLMITEFQQTVSTPTTLSPIVQAEYRSAKDGKILGSQCYVYSQGTLERYVTQTLEWWKGGREAKGVDIEEAFKCRVCAFAEGCEWRVEKVEEAARRARERKSIAGKKWKV